MLAVPPGRRAIYTSDKATSETVCSAGSPRHHPGNAKRLNEATKDVPQSVLTMGEKNDGPGEKNDGPRTAKEWNSGRRCS